ncbi:tetratricopeptide repeat protein [Litorimonas sp. WD9-15]|uniref:tetratricopeptide repeat protein n=1 Tax=Litorimonas sp. WD9-15 TaxID=3418716 RepID=UPI003D094EF6
MFLRLLLSLCLSLMIGVSAVAAEPDYAKLDDATLSQLMEAGDGQAAFTLAFNAMEALEEQTVTSDQADAVIAMMLRADELGSAEAPNALALIYEGQIFETVTPDSVKAGAALERAVERGSEAAALNLGLRLLGNEDPAAHDRAFSLLDPLRESETIGALTASQLLEPYLMGYGARAPQMDKVRETATQCSEHEPSESYCAFIMGRALQSGWGGPTDPAAATPWFAQSAKAGDARAQWYYAMALLQGLGIAVDQAEAYKWVKASAEQNHINGLISFAVMSAQGDGTDVNFQAAFDAYDTAAKLGSAHALRGLSGMLISGEGRAVELDKGLAGLIVAADNGDDLALKLFDMMIEGSASPEEKRAAQRLKLSAEINEVKTKYGFTP